LQRDVVARVEATRLGLDIRYIVTSLAGTPEHLYEQVSSSAAGSRPRAPSAAARPTPRDRRTSPSTCRTWRC
jgi:hypothetical protein